MLERTKISRFALYKEVQIKAFKKELMFKDKIHEA